MLTKTAGRSPDRTGRQPAEDLRLWQRAKTEALVDRIPCGGVGSASRRVPARWTRLQAYTI